MPVPAVLLQLPLLIRQLPLGCIPMVLQGRQALGSVLIQPSREVKGNLL